ncbi:transposase family protein [Myxococcus sp. AM009]|uniref:DDE-type integrase/transposase/recombinase n=1 Tax=Myxococcus sp. AM009 TaxID=2745137 RepID=UPI0015963071|nr:DDE-type integrase/transposase/recombinase [Myxococcus sp. AM009]NVJ00813.1 transposase family protein [Myxococcus sp. AM009]
MLALKSQPALVDDQNPALRDDCVDDQNPALFDDRQHLRREHPSASVLLLLRTLVAQRRLRQGAVSPTTVRRLFASAGLDRVSQRKSPAGTPRRRREAAFPGALWHGDVCHGPTLAGGVALRVHALLDDSSRYVVALEAHSSEREMEMMDLFVAALRRRGRPDALYLDNGSTYSGLALATACARLGTRLMHARPRMTPRPAGRWSASSARCARGFWTTWTPASPWPRCSGGWIPSWSATTTASPTPRWWGTRRRWPGPRARRTCEHGEFAKAA